MINKLYGYVIVALAALVAIWRVYVEGQKSAYNKVKVVAKDTQLRAYSTLIRAKEKSREGLKNVKKKLSNNDYSSFNDD